MPQINGTTTFYVTQTVNGCESPVSPVVVPIHPVAVSFMANADTLVSPVADNYRWYFNGELIKGAVNQKYIVRNTGEYSLRTVTNGCESQSAPVQHTINVAEPKLQISPNPTAGKLKIELQATETGKVHLIIYDRVGKKVQEFVTEKPYTVLDNTLYVTSLKPGMYYLEVRLGKSVLKQKFVKL